MLLALEVALLEFFEDELRIWICGAETALEAGKVVVRLGKIQDRQI